MLQKHGREYIRTPQDLKDELIMELNNMILFASGEVLDSMQRFIKMPSQQYFHHVAIAMRKDLWGGSISMRQLEGISL
ncbi:MAG: hypothetical protein PHV77_04655 [Candidatus Omnitrophica bacterium]|nr:hypothetical protein [Candidatus Omnitrophota bacterium]